MTQPLPTGLSLAQALQPPTADEWNTAELGVAQQMGLPTTQWQAGSVERTIFAVTANMLNQADVAGSITIQAGFLDFAASGTVTYTDATGATQTLFVTPDPSIPAQNPTGALGWLDVLVDSVYAIQRILLGPAAGTLALVNTSLTTYGAFAAGGYHVAQPGLPTKPTYSNVAALTIAPSAKVGGGTGAVSAATNAGPIQVTVATHGLSNGAVVVIAGALGNTAANGAWVVAVVDVNNFTLAGSVGNGGYTGGGVAYVPTLGAFAADVFGTASNAASGNLVTQPVTSLIGVTVANVGAWLGQNTEGNLALADRARLKLQAISSGGPEGAYLFFALTAQSYTSTLNPPLTGRPATAITNAVVSIDKLTGTVTTTIANAAGVPAGLPYPQSPIVDDGSDVYAVGAVIQAWAVPWGTTAITQAASVLSVTVALTAFVPIGSASAAVPIIQIATQAYFSGVPIGGITDDNGITYILPLQGVLDAVAVALAAANIRPQNLVATLNGSATDLAMTSTQRAVLVTPFTPTVVGI